MKKTVLAPIIISVTALITGAGFYATSNSQIKKLNAEDNLELVTLETITSANVFYTEEQTYGYEYNFKQTTRWGDDFEPDTSYNLPYVQAFDFNSVSVKTSDEYIFKATEAV